MLASKDDEEIISLCILLTKQVGRSDNASGQNLGWDINYPV
jgi:hypothetical protein